MSTWPSLWTKKLGTPNNPAIHFTRGTDFVATMVRNCYGLSGCSPPWTDLTVKHFGHRGLLLPGFRQVRSPLPSLDITTTVTGLLVWGFFCQEVSARSWGFFCQEVLARSFSRAAYLSSFVSFFV